MQDEHGQVLEAQLDLGRARLSGRRARAQLPVRAIGRARYEAVTDAEVIEAFQLLSRTEGIIPALEPAHAIAWVVRAGAGAGRAHRAASTSRAGATRTWPR